MEYKKAELLINDSYAVELRFMQDAYRGANQEWRNKITECFNVSPSHNILLDCINIPKSLVEEALNDKNVCKEWKVKIREVFNIKDSYHIFSEGDKLETSSEHPLFIGFGMVPWDDRYKCLLSNMDMWDVESDVIKIQGTKYLKLKFKKK